MHTKGCCPICATKLLHVKKEQLILDIQCSMKCFLPSQAHLLTAFNPISGNFNSYRLFFLSLFIPHPQLDAFQLWKVLKCTGNSSGSGKHEVILRDRIFMHSVHSPINLFIVCAEKLNNGRIVL